MYIYDSDIKASRVSIPTNLSRGKASQNYMSLQAEVFISRNERFNQDCILEDTLNDMVNIFGFWKNSVKLAKSEYIKYSYVVSDHKRAGCVSEILNYLDQNGVYSMGLLGRWKYIWSDVAFLQGQNTGQKIKQRIMNSGRR